MAERRRVGNEFDRGIKKLQRDIEETTGKELSYPEATDLAARMGMGAGANVIILPKRKGRLRVNEIEDLL